MRRGGTYPHASTHRGGSRHAAARIESRRAGQAAVLEEMAAYLRTQAGILAHLGEGLRPRTARANEVVRGASRPRRRQTRASARRQSPASALDDRASTSRNTRGRRQSEGGRCKDQKRRL